MFDWFKNFIGKMNGFSSCHHCGDTWNWKKEYVIPYNNRGSGMFPLCEECYEKLSPQERFNYCRELYYSWNRPEKEMDWNLIAKHVGLQ